MKSVVQRLFLFAGMALVAVPRLFGADPTNAEVSAWNKVLQPDSGQPFGIETRIPWTTSRLVGSPDPPLPYVVKRVFPKLNFKEPVDLTSTPAVDRFFIAELSGKIFSFPTDSDDGQPDLVVDLRTNISGFNQTYGMTFHPGFATNRFVYVCYVFKDGVPDGTHVSRFIMTRTDPPQIDPASEKIIITWVSGGHNGGCLKFGPDGYLYISTGDAASPDPADPLNTGQDISDLLSSILRIDVDHEHGGKPYGVPADNPFVNTAGARPEVWSYGSRNPCRWSFHRQTRALTVGGG